MEVIDRWIYGFMYFLYCLDFYFFLNIQVYENVSIIKYIIIPEYNQ